MHDADAAPSAQRIDQWLWFARIVKSRTLAQALIERGKVRLNKARIEKTSQSVKAGDVLTISLGPKVRIVQVMAHGVRRGPAIEAARLYLELTPAPETTKTDAKGESGAASVAHTAAAVRPKGEGRPTKRDRRALDRLKGFDR
jgi:ribosome-associated heat shock protein Hsp15